MNLISRAKLVAIGFCLTGTGIAVAQDAEEEADVWAVVERQWDADEKDDKKWVDELLADDFAGWPTNSPAPRSKESVKMWDRFTETQGRSLAHELYPLAIVVHDDVAVAHYLYTSAFEDNDGKVERSNGRYTDVLVRTDDGWKFLTWHGGDSE